MQSEFDDEIRIFHEKVDNLNQKIETYNGVINNLQNKLIRIDRYCERKCIREYDVPENEKDKCIVTVMSFLTEIMKVYGWFSYQGAVNQILLLYLHYIYYNISNTAAYMQINSICLFGLFYLPNLSADIFFPIEIIFSPSNLK